jgi:hypothetical protein
MTSTVMDTELDAEMDDEMDDALPLLNQIAHSSHLCVLGMVTFNSWW